MSTTTMCMDLTMIKPIETSQHHLMNLLKYQRHALCYIMTWFCRWKLRHSNRRITTTLTI